jgi:hypothetical protein
MTLKVMTSEKEAGGPKKFLENKFFILFNGNELHLIFVENSKKC